ncbi:ABC transporter ATP-binding protein [Sphingobacterium sp.]|uniref:ABC transporter ATP-binding protein n=1 Tax=Sphingobacterium sp. TaxID=341027 RepID=UPI002FDED634
MNYLHIENLSKTYSNGVKAITDFSLNIGNGMFGLLGPNGAGKSTLMKIIAGLQNADTGSIIFNDTNILNDPTFIKKQLGYLPQDFGVYPHLSTYQLMHHLAVLKGIEKEGRKDHILDLLSRVNLYEFRNKEVQHFSGGMRQRFGIAQALLGTPQIVIVDEPTAGLDPQERNRFNNLLSEIGEQIIVVLSTHIVEDVRSLCSQMAIVNSGKLIAHGAPNDFLQSLEGLIWTKTINKDELSYFNKNFITLSAQLNGGRLSIHIYAKESPGNGFEKVQPDLEDVYFTQLSQIV